jgi:hypothetical protein
LDIVADTKLVRFFAPDQIRKRAREWGAGEFNRRYNEALDAVMGRAPSGQMVWLSSER